MMRGRAPEVRAGGNNLQPANLEPEILGPRQTGSSALHPLFVTTKVARLETTKTRSHKGTKKEKVKFLVFLVSLYLCGD